MLILRGEAPPRNQWTGNLLLDDLLVALRYVHEARTEGISCSIDPTLPWGHPEKYKAAFDSNLDRVCQTVLGYSAGMSTMHWQHEMVKK